MTNYSVLSLGAIACGEISRPVRNQACSLLDIYELLPSIYPTTATFVTSSLPPSSGSCPWRKSMKTILVNGLQQEQTLKHVHVADSTSLPFPCGSYVRYCSILSIKYVLLTIS